MKSSKLGSFPWFFVEQSFRTASWPKKVGILRTSYVPQVLLTVILDQMAEVAVALGAGRPEIALGILTTLFGNRDWQRQPAHEIFSAYDSSETVRSAMGQAPPWTAIAEVLGWRASPDLLIREASASISMGKCPTVSWSLLQRKEFQISIILFFARSILWGFTHPGDAYHAIEEDCVRIHGQLDNAIRSGVSLPEKYACLSAEQFVQQATLVAEAYEGRYRMRFRACKEILETTQARERLGGSPPAPPRYWTRESRLSDAVPISWLLLNAQGRIAYYCLLTTWMARLRSDALEESPATSLDGSFLNGN